MKNKLTFSAKQITGIAVLIALVIVLQAVGGSIPIGAIQLNFTLIPIVLSGIIFGALAGALTGFACGVVVLIQVITAPAGLYALMWAGDPVVVVLVCLLKTTVAGFLAGYVYDLIAKKNKMVATFVASAIVPIVNTALFIIGCLFMTNSIYFSASESGQNVFAYIIIVLVSFNFFFELAVNLIVAPALSRVLKTIKTIKF